MEGYKVALVARGAGIRFWLRRSVSSRAAHKSIDFAAFCLPLASPSLCDMQRSETFHRDRSRRATRDIYSVTGPRYPVEALTNCGPRTHSSAGVWTFGSANFSAQFRPRSAVDPRLQRGNKWAIQKGKINLKKGNIVVSFHFLGTYVCVRACVFYDSK